MWHGGQRGSRSDCSAQGRAEPSAEDAGFHHALARAGIFARAAGSKAMCSTGTTQTTLRRPRWISI
eukprot:4697856-Pleurochrysis_carterae.AAC.4